MTPPRRRAPTIFDAAPDFVPSMPPAVAEPVLPDLAPAPAAPSLRPPALPRPGGRRRAVRAERPPRSPRTPRPPRAPRPARRTPAAAARAAPASRPRVLAAAGVRAICTLAAVVLVLSALMLVAQANEANALVRFVGAAAGRLDLVVFDVDNGVMKFAGDRADLKDALFNRGVAAMVWLFAGRALGRAISGVGRTPDRDSITVR